FPMAGVPTLLCALAAFVLRLNFPALQVVNNLCSPLQIALLIPFVRLGSRLLGARGPARLGADALIHLVTGWFCLAVPAATVLYFVLVYAFRKRRRECFNRLESPA